MKSYLPFFESTTTNPDGSTPLLHEAVVVEALVYMVRVSEVEDEDVFKTCLEFWAHFCRELYNAEAQFRSIGGANLGTMGGMGVGATGMGTVPGMPGSVATGSTLRGGKQAIYESVLHSLRILMIDHMAKPEEVLLLFLKLY